jgi:hypothetical protein
VSDCNNAERIRAREKKKKMWKSWREKEDLLKDKPQTINPKPWESNEEKETFDKLGTANRRKCLPRFLWVNLRENHT